MKTVVVILITMGLLLAMPMSGHAGNSSTRYFFGFNVGIPLYGPPAYAPGPYWGPPPYYYAPPQVVVVPQQSQTYVQRNQYESDYWYFCPNPQGYYPYIRSCPGGWMKVVPDTVPPGR